MRFNLIVFWAGAIKSGPRLRNFSVFQNTLDSNVHPSLITTLFQGNDSIVAKTTVTVPNDGGPIEAVSTIETVPYWTRSRRKTGLLNLWLNCLC